MAQDVVVLPVHGMGDTELDFADELRDELADELGAEQWAKVFFSPVYYQDVLQPNEAAVMRRMRRRDIDWLRLRRFVLFGFSDAAGLEHRAEEKNSPYAQVQSRIQEALYRAYDFFGGARPVIIVAQSLGGQVVSNYLWDAQKKQGASRGVWAESVDNSARTKFAKLRSLRYLHTTGCNIPIFLSAFPEKDIKAVRTSSGGYSFLWKNYYDSDDVLGWPLQPLSSSYRKAVYRDYQVNANGSLLAHVASAWNPLSHTQYWADSDVVRPLVRDIRSLLD